MPLPLFLIAAAAAAGVSGIGIGIHGCSKMIDANDKLNTAKEQDKRNTQRLCRTNKTTCKMMDKLGKNEMEVLASFGHFSDLFAKIKNKPEFAKIELTGVKLPNFEGQKFRDISVAASVLVGGAGGAALGTLGGFAASGATTTAVTALASASTGTAISSLSGAAATNATLAALGGGSLATGGGGMALGSMVLGAASLGVGLLVGGVIFSFTGSNLSEKADKACEQVRENERKINKICSYLDNLYNFASEYNRELVATKEIYDSLIIKMENIIDCNMYNGTVDWNKLKQYDKTVINNVVLIVGVLYNMCKVKLVSQSKTNDVNVINKSEANEAMTSASRVRYEVLKAA